MNIETLFKELANTVHHKVNLDSLLKEKSTALQQIIANNDALSLKSLLNEKVILADRTTIFDL